MALQRKIPYNKKDKGKILHSGGPRDQQRKLQQTGTADIQMPKVDIGELKNILLNDQQTREELKVALKSDLESVDKRVQDGVRKVVREEVDTVKKSIEDIEAGGGLPFDVVQKKIEEAVRHTQQKEKERYESGIGNLNSQLNQAKENVKKLRRELLDKKNELDKSRMKVGVLESRLKEKEATLGQVETELQLSEKERREEVADLRLKMTELLEKIMEGKVSLEGRRFEDEEGHVKRPTLEDVFIDPLEELSTDLDSHIDANVTEAADATRDIRSDVDKLKNLLSRKQYKPVKGTKSKLVD